MLERLQKCGNIREKHAPELHDTLILLKYCIIVLYVTCAITDTKSLQIWRLTTDHHAMENSLCSKGRHDIDHGYNTSLLNQVVL